MKLLYNTIQSSRMLINGRKQSFSHLIGHTLCHGYDLELMQYLSPIT